MSSQVAFEGARARALAQAGEGRGRASHHPRASRALGHWPADRSQVPCRGRRERGRRTGATCCVGSPQPGEFTPSCHVTNNESPGAGDHSDSS